MKAALTLLKLLTERYPPTDPCRHAIVLGEDGHLNVQLSVRANWVAVTLDDAALALPPAELLLAIGDVVALAI